MMTNPEKGEANLPKSFIHVTKAFLVLVSSVILRCKTQDLSFQSLLLVNHTGGKETFS